MSALTDFLFLCCVPYFLWLVLGVCYSYRECLLNVPNFEVFCRHFSPFFAIFSPFFDIVRHFVSKSVLNHHLPPFLSMPSRHFVCSKYVETFPPNPPRTSPPPHARVRVNPFFWGRGDGTGASEDLVGESVPLRTSSSGGAGLQGLYGPVWGGGSDNQQFTHWVEGFKIKHEQMVKQKFTSRRLPTGVRGSDSQSSNNWWNGFKFKNELRSNRGHIQRLS